MDGFHKRERHTVFTDDGWYPTPETLVGSGTERSSPLHGQEDRSHDQRPADRTCPPPRWRQRSSKLPEVRAAFVIGTPAGDRGEDVSAVLVPQSGCRVDQSTVLEAVRKTLFFVQGAPSPDG